MVRTSGARGDEDEERMIIRFNFISLFSVSIFGFIYFGVFKFVLFL